MTKVADLMTTAVITCSPQTSVKDAARLMYLNGLTGLPVVDEHNTLVGLLTEHDLIRIEERLHLPGSLGILGSVVYLDNPLNGDEVEKQIAVMTAATVSQLMATDMPVVSPEAPLEDAAELFIHRNANPLPVASEGRLVGIISQADIVKLLADDEELRKHPWRELVKKM